MKKRIYLVLETEADEDDKSIRSDIEKELGMATHYFEIVSYSENGFQDKWRNTKENPPTKDDSTYGKVIAMYADSAISQPAKWDFVADAPDLFQFWMPFPKPPKEV